MKSRKDKKISISSNLNKSEYTEKEEFYWETKYWTADITVIKLSTIFWVNPAFTLE